MFFTQMSMRTLYNPKKIHAAYMLLKQLDNGYCEAIQTALWKYGELCVTDIWIYVVRNYKTMSEINQPDISLSLARMRKAGVVKSRRDGKQIFYSLDSERIERLNEITKELAGEV